MSLDTLDDDALEFLKQFHEYESRKMDPARIDRILGLLRDYWMAFPDTPFRLIAERIEARSTTKELSRISDEELEQILAQFVKASDEK